MNVHVIYASKQASDTLFVGDACVACKEHDKRRGKKTWCDYLSINANEQACIVLRAMHVLCLVVVNWLILPVSYACLKD